MDPTIYHDFTISFYPLYREEKKIDFTDGNKALYQACYPDNDRVCESTLSSECTPY